MADNRFFAKAVTAASAAGAVRRMGAMMACFEGETIYRVAALIESSRALSGVVALLLASTLCEEITASEMDVLTDLSYEIYLNLDQLKAIWAQVSDELTREHS